MSDAREPPAAPEAQGGARPAAPAPATGRDRVLLVVFWAWAALLALLTLAQLLGWQGVIDAFDVKKWFAR